MAHEVCEGGCWCVEHTLTVVLVRVLNRNRMKSALVTKRITPDSFSDLEAGAPAVRVVPQ